uniref:G-protein coupled receptors family 1 profile domain-containing protein n=1 Tax=Ciona intestinalis TaxID=7719 RepID=H2XYK4_CIOIN
MRVNHLYFVTIMLALLSCLMAYFEMGFGYLSNEWCDVKNYLHSIFFFSGLLCIFVLLWFRQHSFYSDPLLKHYTCRLLRYLSTIMIGIICGFLVAFCVYFCLINVKSHPAGCGIKNEKDRPQRSNVMALFIYVYITLHAILLALMAFPLSKTKRENTAPDVYSAIRRMVVCSTLCVVPNVASALVLLYLSSTTYVYFSSVTTTNNLICTFA